jgi:BirA family biotin operon repressor/biotin-[acetyl-CoA-carboxylase] ligase
MSLEPLALEQIQGLLTPTAATLFPQIQIFKQLPSTNQWLLEHGQCGDVCLTEQQTAGRGRRGRVWDSPAGLNIYLSLKYCFAAIPEHLGMLGLGIGLSVAEALAQCGIRQHGVKWPNDIYIQNKKVGGILLEAVGALQQVVVGIGLNVNVQPQHNPLITQPWTSLAAEQGQTLNRNRLIAALLNQLGADFQTFSTLNMAEFQRHWQRWDVLDQQPVRVMAGNEQYEGIACGIDSQGQLRLQRLDGSITTFSSADVSVRM